MTFPGEKRKHPRGKAAFSVTYRVREPIHLRMEFGEDEREALAEDICIGGLSLSTGHPLVSGSIVSIKFRATHKAEAGEEGSRKLELRGEVCYCRPAEKKSYRSGIKFEAISGADKKFIEGCV